MQSVLSGIQVSQALMQLPAGEPREASEKRGHACHFSEQVDNSQLQQLVRGQLTRYLSFVGHLDHYMLRLHSV
jgi:hypothetical protein